MTTQRQFVLGLLFVTAFAILGYYTLFLTDFKPFRDVHELTVSFPGAGGLRKGDAVLVAGIRAGKVKSLSYDPSAPDAQRVTVQLSLDEAVPLREGHWIKIEAATLLGGHNVVIDPGPASNTATPAGTALQGAIAADALSGLSELVSDNREKIDGILGSLQTTASEFQLLITSIRTGTGLVARLLNDAELADLSTDGVKSVTRTFDNLSEISDSVLAGRGVVGKLFVDEDLVVYAERIARNLDAIGSELSAITEDWRLGRGTIGRLLTDEEIGEDFTRMVDDLREITTKINSGEGTLGRLVVDDSLARNLESITASLSEGQGTLGKLLTEDMVHRNLAKASEDLSEILSALRDERGTLGKLLYDDDLYVQLKKALTTVNRTLEEYREVAPISSFTNVLFGAF